MATFKLYVTNGVENLPVNGLDAKQMDLIVEAIREWFPGAEFDVEVEDD